MIALTRAASAVADAASCVALPRHAEQPDRVDEAAGAGGDPRQAFVGRRRRRQHHRLDALVVGRAAPRLGLLERKVGQDAPGDAGLDQPMGEAAVPVVMDEVVVGHHDQRDVDVERRHGGEHRQRGRPGVERRLRRLLDHRPVHHRVGERDADLDRVGAVGGGRPDRVLPTRDSRR